MKKIREYITLLEEGKKLFLTLANILAILFIIWVFDLLNYDNELYELVNKSLGITNFDYFDLPYLDFLGVAGVLITAFIPFHILLEQQKDNKLKTVLEHKPFLEPSQIRFNPFDSRPELTLTNIGSGPAIFVRLSFFKDYEDLPHQAVLRVEEPHSRELGLSTGPSKFFFDPRLFANFLTQSERGGELASNPDNYNNRSLREELNDLFRSKVGQTYFIYIHCFDILNNKYVFEVKYLLELEDDYDSRNSEFLLKRMEVRQV